MLDIDVIGKTCTIECGIQITTLDPKLADAKLAMPTNVLLTSPQYGGIVATGCHGPGVNLGN